MALERNEYSLKRTAHRCFLPSFGSFGQAVSEKIFLNQPIRNKRRLWRPCSLKDRDEMSILYRGPSIDASYQVSVHLARRFRRRRFFRNCMWWPCLLTNRDKMSNLYRGHSKNAFYQVSDQLDLQFQRRKVNRRQTPSDAKSSHCLWQGELKSFKILIIF